MNERNGDEGNASRAMPPPRSADEALERARRHALAALAEAIAAARCVLDAAALATTGAPGEAHEWLRDAAQWLDAAAEQARRGAGRPLAPWLEAVSDALDDEIERWEARSRHDPEARSVLRAFLGVREILWEFGLRASSDDASDEARAARAAAPAPASAPRSRPLRSTRRGPTRLERVPVEG